MVIGSLGSEAEADDERDGIGKPCERELPSDRLSFESPSGQGLEFLSRNFRRDFSHGQSIRQGLSGTFGVIYSS